MSDWLVTIKLQVTNFCGETVSESSGRHNKPNWKPRRGEKRDTRSPEAQGVHNNSEAVTQHPTNVSQI